MSDMNDVDGFGFDLDDFINYDDDDLSLGVSNSSEQHVSVERRGGSGSPYSDISEGGGGSNANANTTGGEQLRSDGMRHGINLYYGENINFAGESRKNIVGYCMPQDAHGNEKPLGLKLTRTPETLTCIENAIALNTNKLKNAKEKKKTKASNIPTLSLEIGNFKVNSGYEGNLVTKFYFSKRKLVWEILEGPLKRKIEMSWSDIEGIHADIASGTLKIELHQPPSFAKEINPTPFKHTQWEETTDFTDGQAQLFRIHMLKFSPGVVDKHYEKLLQYDQRIFRLSRSHFPTDMSPRFNTIVVHASHFPSMLPPPMRIQEAIPFASPNTNVCNSVDVIGEVPLPLPLPVVGGMFVPEMENHWPNDFQGILPLDGSTRSPAGWVDMTLHNNTHNYNDVSYPYSTETTMSDLHRVCQGAMTMQNPRSIWESMLENTNNWLEKYPQNFNNYTAAPNNPQFLMMPNVTETEGLTNYGLMGGGMENEYLIDIVQNTFANEQNLQQGQSATPQLSGSNYQVKTVVRDQQQMINGSKQ